LYTASCCRNAENVHPCHPIEPCADNQIEELNDSNQDHEQHVHAGSLEPRNLTESVGTKFSRNTRTNTENGTPNAFVRVSYW
jgi:hypothetical protein